MSNGQDRPPRRGPSQLADLLGPVTEKSLAKFGFAESALLSHWTSIVGANLARYCVPVRLRFPAGARRGGTLTVLVDGPAAVELQHDTPRILERVNTFLGYPAISVLKLQQGVMPPSPEPRRAPIRLDQGRTAEIADTVRPIADPALKASLTRLGEAISRAHLQRAARAKR